MLREPNRKQNEYSQLFKNKKNMNRYYENK